MFVTVMSLNLCVPLLHLLPEPKSNHPLSQPPTTSSSSNSRPIPTKLQSNPTTISPNQRRTIIAGSTAGFVILFLLLGSVLYHRRRKNEKFEFLDALAAPTQNEHSRAMLLAGEDMDGFGSQLRGGDESFKMGYVRGGSAGRDRIGIYRAHLQLHAGTRV